MRNLAGDLECDIYIRFELVRAAIKPVDHAEKVGGEVPARLTGTLGPFTFRRAWTYWVVDGPIPLSVAEEMFAARPDDVRSGGDCACRPPLTWAEHFNADGRRLETDVDGKQATQWEHFAAKGLPAFQVRPMFVQNAAADAARSVVTLYHIDSEDGLRYFADTIRKHGLASAEST
jgi:hypothetical protein